MLWSLSVAATAWQPRERLSRMCTIPINGVLDQAWDTASFAMEAQIFDLFCGLGYSSIGRRTPKEISLEDGISIANPVCSIASCLLR